MFIEDPFPLIGGITEMARKRSLRNHICELTTVLLNPISDNPSHRPSSTTEDEAGVEKNERESNSEEGEGSVASMAGPDTSSFTAFLYSLLRDDYFAAESEDEYHDNGEALATKAEAESVNLVRDSSGRKRGVLYRGKQYTIGKAMNYAAMFAGFRNQESDRKPNSATIMNEKNESQDDGRESRLEESNNEGLSLDYLPVLSEPSLLLTQKTRIKIHASLPTLVKGRKWVLLYSTWRHGISLSTLYRRSTICPGLSLLVVGDREGAVFGGLLESPLKPSKSRRYQGTNSTFVFSDVSGQPAIYYPTGANRYYTLCSPDFLALGGVPHFALYLDGDLNLWVCLLFIKQIKRI